jgi:hypothetical protein
MHALQCNAHTGCIPVAVQWQLGGLRFRTALLRQFAAAKTVCRGTFDLPRLETPREFSREASVARKLHFLPPTPGPESVEKPERVKQFARRLFGRRKPEREFH